MEKKNDGGPVNPVFTGMVSKEFQGTSNDDFLKVIETKLVNLKTGLSVRDYFAGLALQAILSRTSAVIDVLIKDCYDIADAMIKAREIRA